MYTVKELAQKTGLTPRTLRYYDAIGLLHPARATGNDYRLYGPQEIDRLEQILLYRAMGVPLEEIRHILDAPGFDRAGALRGHLERLLERRREVEELIHMVCRTLEDMEGGSHMSDKERFESMKRQAVRENEAAYGQEVREKYGDEAADSCAARVTGMTEEAWNQMKAEEEGYQAALRRAAASGDPAGVDAQEAVRLHGQWLGHFWKPEAVTPQAHIALIEMYGQDPRFADYYEAIAPGCTAFFAKAAQAYYEKKD